MQKSQESSLHMVQELCGGGKDREPESLVRRVESTADPHLIGNLQNPRKEKQLSARAARRRAKASRRRERRTETPTAGPTSARTQKHKPKVTIAATAAPSPAPTTAAAKKSGLHCATSRSPAATPPAAHPPTVTVRQPAKHRLIASLVGDSSLLSATVSQENRGRLCRRLKTLFLPAPMPGVKKHKQTRELALAACNCFLGKFLGQPTLLMLLDLEEQVGAPWGARTAKQSSRSRRRKVKRPSRAAGVKSRFAPARQSADRVPLEPITCPDA